MQKSAGGLDTFLWEQGMGRPRKEERPEDTVLLLLRAAEEAFGSNGFRETRLGDIAEAVGIRRSSLLYHFGSKEKLHSAVVDRAFKEMREVIASSITLESDAGLQLDALVDGLLEFAKERPGLVRVILRQMVDPRGANRDQIADEMSTLVTSLEQIFRGVAAEQLDEDFPLNQAILQIISGYLVKAASVDLGSQLWGSQDHTRALAHALLLGQTPPPRSAK